MCPWAGRARGQCLYSAGMSDTADATPDPTPDDLTDSVTESATPREAYAVPGSDVAGVTGLRSCRFAGVGARRFR